MGVFIIHGAYGNPDENWLHFGQCMTPILRIEKAKIIIDFCHHAKVDCRFFEVVFSLWISQGQSLDGIDVGLVHEPRNCLA